MPSALVGFDGAHLGLLWRSTVIEIEKNRCSDDFPLKFKSGKF